MEKKKGKIELYCQVYWLAATGLQECSLAGELCRAVYSAKVHRLPLVLGSEQMVLREGKTH